MKDYDKQIAKNDKAIMDIRNDIAQADENDLALLTELEIDLFKAIEVAADYKAAAKYQTRIEELEVKAARDKSTMADIPDPSHEAVKGGESWQVW